MTRTPSAAFSAAVDRRRAWGGGEVGGRDDTGSHSAPRERRAVTASMATGALVAPRARPRGSRDAPGPLTVPSQTRENGAGDPRDALLELYNLHDEPPPSARAAFPGVDPWRWQYFEGVACPARVAVPVDDAAAWGLYPGFREVYNKLFICATQGIAHAPHGVMPPRFPVFSKPIVNLHGMGAGGFILRSAADLDAHFTPGHFWMTLLEGRHISTDVALVGGAPRWWSHTEGRRLPGGRFDYWTVLGRPLPRLEAYCRRWIRRHLRGFTGIVNFESISGKIIECHLRMSEQWIDLHGPGRWSASWTSTHAAGGGSTSRRAAATALRCSALTDSIIGSTPRSCAGCARPQGCRASRSRSIRGGRSRST